MGGELLVWELEFAGEAEYPPTWWTPRKGPERSTGKCGKSFGFKYPHAWDTLVT